MFHLYIHNSFGKTIAFHQMENNHHFTAQIDHFRTMSTIKRVWMVLGLPDDISFLWESKFLWCCYKSRTLCWYHIFMVYRCTDRVDIVKRMYLLPIWYTLFSIINQCVTFKSTRLYRCTVFVLRILHGIVFNK